MSYTHSAASVNSNTRRVLAWIGAVLQVVALPALLFALAVAAIVAGLAPPAVALGAAARALVLSGVLIPHMAYDALDLPVPVPVPVPVLLAAMLPVGGALETAGTAGLIADAILAAPSSR